jgi:hypothetical protein
VRRGNPQLPSLGVHLQYLMSPALRESLGMVEGKHTGVMCARADYGSAAFGTLLPGDVLLEVDGHKVANDGSINLYGRRLQLVCTSTHPDPPSSDVHLSRATVALKPCRGYVQPGGLKHVFTHAQCQRPALRNRGGPTLPRDCDIFAYRSIWHQVKAASSV